MSLRNQILTALLAVSLPAGSAAAQLGVPVDSSAPGPTATAGADSGRVEEAGPLSLEVSLSERMLRVRQGGAVLASYPVAVGKAQHPTPAGEFQIRRVIWNPRWVPPKVPWARGKRAREPGDPDNPMGKVKMFFREPDYYIHGTNNEESLGQAASHGCVRMANADVVEVARLVMEHGGERKEPGWFQRVLNVFRSSKEVRLPTPVTVVIRG